ncbi:MAG: hypothetical protein WCD49_07210 [Candidatus Acidiferrales bacterium]
MNAKTPTERKKEDAEMSRMHRTHIRWWEHRVAVGLTTPEVAQQFIDSSFREIEPEIL